MDLFEEKAEKLRHKLHETKSMRQRQEVFDLSRKPGQSPSLPRLGEVISAIVNAKKVGQRMRSNDKIKRSQEV